METLENPANRAIEQLTIEHADAFEYVINEIRSSPPMVARLFSNIRSSEIISKILNTSLSDDEAIRLISDDCVSAKTVSEWIRLLSPERQTIVWDQLLAQSPARYRELKAVLEHTITMASGVIIENFHAVNASQTVEQLTESILDEVDTASDPQQLSLVAQTLFSKHMAVLPDVLKRLATAGQQMFANGITQKDDFFRFVKWCYLVEPLLAYDESKILTRETLKLLHRTLVEMPSAKWVLTILSQIPDSIASGYEAWVKRQKNPHEKIRSALLT